MTAPARRVLQVYGPRDGGVAEHVLRLSEALAGRGWEVEVAAPPGSPAAGALAAQGLGVHTMAFARAPHPDDVATARRLRALDAVRGFTVVHAHSSKAGALVRASLPRARRLVYTPHCFAFAASFGRFSEAQRRAYALAEQVLVPRTGAMIAVSDWERREGERRLRGTAGRLVRVHNGVPAADPGAVPDPALAAFARGGPLVGSVCRLDPRKDPLTLVRAAARLRDEGRLGFRVAVVGNGPLRDAVEAEIRRLALGDAVRVVPFETGAGAYLAALDAYVLPSAWESFPIGVLEAMAAGVPVIASRTGGTPEAVTDRVDGRLVDSGDAASLAAALAEVMGDAEARAALGRAGRETWRRRFTVERMTDEIEALYERSAAAAAA